MPIPQNTQHLLDKQHKFFGSDRVFYTGASLGSTTAWTNISFSGAATGFGWGTGSTASEDMSQRFAIVASGGNTSGVEWSWDSGTTIHGVVYPSESLTFDGKSHGGIALRSASATHQVRVWVW